MSENFSEKNTVDIASLRVNRSSRSKRRGRKPRTVTQYNDLCNWLRIAILIPDRGLFLKEFQKRELFYLHRHYINIGVWQFLILRFLVRGKGTILGTTAWATFLLLTHRCYGHNLTSNYSVWCMTSVSSLDWWYSLLSSPEWRCAYRTNNITTDNS